MPEDKQTHVTIHGGDTWLGKNLPQFEGLQGILEELDTRNDSLPPNFNPRVLLQFLRGAVGEIKRVTAMNHALTQALKEHNREKKAFAEGKLVEK